MEVVFEYVAGRLGKEPEVRHESTVPVSPHHLRGHKEREVDVLLLDLWVFRVLVVSRRTVECVFHEGLIIGRFPDYLFIYPLGTCCVQKKKKK